MSEPQLPEPTTQIMGPPAGAGGTQQLPTQFDDYDDGFADTLPVRPRARYLTPVTALLMALILGGVGFYVGIRVEKSQTTSSAAGGRASAFARAFGAGASAGAGAGKTGSGGAGASAAGLAGRFAAAFGGAGGATAGSVTEVDGNTIYVQEAGGNTVKVKLTSATKLTKSEPVSRKKIFPGDQVVVSCSTAAKGTVDATSVSDSGSSAASSGTSTSSGSSAAGGSASSAISSLFGG